MKRSCLRETIALTAAALTAGAAPGLSEGAQSREPAYGPEQTNVPEHICRVAGFYILKRELPTHKYVADLQAFANCGKGSGDGEWYKWSIHVVNPDGTEKTVRRSRGSLTEIAIASPNTALDGNFTTGYKSETSTTEPFEIGAADPYTEIVLPQE